ncbi:hypothetical protein AGMMS49546_10320 [Spirochaetia bacterium]|nr:hypothetical protein AGMMS49546_10320 [Spirochaetia bacterium]
MNNYEPVLIWELTRAASSIVAWWVLSEDRRAEPFCPVRAGQTAQEFAKTSIKPVETTVLLSQKAP